MRDHLLVLYEVPRSPTSLALSLTLRPFLTITMVVPFGIQHARGLYDSDVEEVYVNLQTWEPLSRDLYAPSTLLDPDDDDSCSENSDFHLESPSPSRTLFSFDLRRAPADDLLFYYCQRYIL